VAGDLIRGSLADAGRHLAQATGALPAVPADRRGRVRVMLAVLRLFLARRLVDVPVVVEEAQRLLAITEVPPSGSQARWARSHGLDEPLTDSETRVLRYLPTHLTAPEIANELYLSVNTVSTHTRHLYAKLGVHSRHEAVDRARALGLLAPSTRRAQDGITTAM